MASGILACPQEAEEFCRTVLVPTGGQRLLQPTARNKYAGGALSKSSIVLDQQVIRFDGGESEDSVVRGFMRELRKVDAICRAGLYVDYSRGQASVADTSVPPEAISVYITAMPLDPEDACDVLFEKLWQRRKEARRSGLRHVQATRSVLHGGATSGWPLHSKVLSCLHSCPSRDVKLLKLDVDTKDGAKLASLKNVLCDTEVVAAVETRGGYHILLNRSKGLEALHKFVSQLKTSLLPADVWVSIERDSPMFAVPGTLQGGFPVRMATEEWIHTNHSP